MARTMRSSSAKRGPQVTDDDIDLQRLFQKANETHDEADITAAEDALDRHLNDRLAEASPAEFFQLLGYTPPSEKIAYSDDPDIADHATLQQLYEKIMDPNAVSEMGNNKTEFRRLIKDMRIHGTYK